MKTSFLLIVLLSMAVLCQAQNETQISNVSFEEVTISPPVFMGHKYSPKVNPELSLAEYVRANCYCPKPAVRLQKAGSEVVSFVITAEGKITEIDVINSVHSSIDGEVIRVLEKTSGMWKPAIVDGKPAKMQKELCITFSPESENVMQQFKTCATKHFRTATEAMFIDKKYRKAERFFDKAILYLPYDKSSLLNRGLCRYAQGNIDGAFTDWNRLKDLGGLEITESYAQNLEELEELEGYEELMALLNK